MKDRKINNEKGDDDEVLDNSVSKKWHQLKDTYTNIWCSTQTLYSTAELVNIHSAIISNTTFKNTDKGHWFASHSSEMILNADTCKHLQY